MVGTPPGLPSTKYDSHTRYEPRKATSSVNCGTTGRACSRGRAVRPAAARDWGTTAATRSTCTGSGSRSCGSCAAGVWAHPRGDPLVVAAEHLGRYCGGRALPFSARTRRQPPRGDGRTGCPWDARRLRQATGASAGSHRKPRQGAVAAGGRPAAWRLGVGPRRVRTAGGLHPAAEPQPLQPGAGRECDLLFPVFDPAVRTPTPRSTEATLCPGFRPPRSLTAIITAPRRQP